MQHRWLTTHIRNAVRATHNMRRVRDIAAVGTAKVIGRPSSKRPPRPQPYHLTEQQKLAPARHTRPSNYASVTPLHTQWPLLSLSRCDRSRGRPTLLSRWQCGRPVSSGKTGAGQSTESEKLTSSNVGKGPSAVSREEGVPAVGDKGETAGGVGGGLPHQVSELYAEMERTLMSKMHAQDKNRFRALGLSGVLLLVWVLSMFGSEIRRYFASQTAEVARETLKVEALQVQTQELATALVQTLLNDQEVVRAGALFLREASTNPETQAAVMSLALYVLQHPETLAETQVLAKKLVKAVLDSPETVEQVTDMALQVMANARFRQGVSELVTALGQSEEVFAAVSDLSSRVIQDPDVQETLTAMLSASSHKVLEDEQIFDHSKEFVAQVMGDDAVQRSGGDALWITVRHALQSRIMKITGLGLLTASALLLLSGKGGRGVEGGGGRQD